MLRSRVVWPLAVAAMLCGTQAFAQEGPERERGDRRERGEDRGERPGGFRGFRPPPNPIMVALDTDKDGEISAAEIKAAAASLKTLDKNNDGKITREEMIPEGFGRGEGRGFGGPPGGGRGFGNFNPEAFAQQMVERMMQADENGDKKISKAEAPERMQERFADIDKNSDGFIDEAEIKAMVADMQSRFGRGRGGRDGEGRRGGDEGDRPRRPPVESADDL